MSFQIIRIMKTVLLNSWTGAPLPWHGPRAALWRCAACSQRRTLPTSTPELSCPLTLVEKVGWMNSKFHFIGFNLVRETIWKEIIWFMFGIVAINMATDLSFIYLNQNARAQLLKLFYIIFALVKYCYSASEESTLTALFRVHLEISYTSSVFERDIFLLMQMRIFNCQNSLCFCELCLSTRSFTCIYFY